MEEKTNFLIKYWKEIGDQIQLLIISGVAGAFFRALIAPEKEIKKRLEDGLYDIFIATSQLIGEGFDCPRLAFLYLTTPIGDEKRLTQYIGRVIRILEGKQHAIIFDFFDLQWLLQITFRKRINTYLKLGIKPDSDGVVVWPTHKVPDKIQAGTVWAVKVTDYINRLRG